MQLYHARGALRLARPPAQLSAIWVHALVEALGGVAPSEILTEHPHPYSWIDVDAYDRMLARAVELSGEPAFGLRWARDSPMLKFDLLTLVLSHAPTLRDALECVLSFQGILAKRTELRVSACDGSLTLEFAPASASELGARLRTEVVFYGLLRLLRCAGVAEDAVWRLSFAHHAPPYADAYAQLHPRAPSFGQAVSALEIDAACLERPLGANRELFEALKAQASLVRARMERDGDYAGRVRDYLGSVLPHVPNMVEAARALALSVRSLRRRLATEGWSYSQLVDEVQQTTARQLLIDPTLSIKQVGFDVGFGTTNAFDRAFKRWTGKSPSAFRSSRLLQVIDGGVR